MFKVCFDKQALQAVSRFSARGDIRYYLNSVFVQANGAETRLVATDGRTLAVHRGTFREENSVTGQVEIIVPIETVLAVLKWKATSKIYAPMPVTMTLPDDYATGGECRIEWCGNVAVFKRVDGKYPDYKRVIPTEITGVMAQYNPEYLCRVQDATGDFLRNRKAAKWIGIQHNGDGAGVCYIHDNMIAVIMPIRSYPSATVEDIAWARGDLLTVSEPKAVETETVETEAVTA